MFSCFILLFLLCLLMNASQEAQRLWVPGLYLCMFDVFSVMFAYKKRQPSTSSTTIAGLHVLYFQCFGIIFVAHERQTSTSSTITCETLDCIITGVRSNQDQMGLVKVV